MSASVTIKAEEKTEDKVNEKNHIKVNFYQHLRQEDKTHLKDLDLPKEKCSEVNEFLSKAEKNNNNNVERISLLTEYFQDKSEHQYAYDSKNRSNYIKMEKDPENKKAGIDYDGFYKDIADTSLVKVLPNENDNTLYPIKTQKYDYTELQVTNSELGDMDIYMDFWDKNESKPLNILVYFFVCFIYLNGKHRFVTLGISLLYIIKVLLHIFATLEAFDNEEQRFMELTQCVFDLLYPTILLIYAWITLYQPRRSIISLYSIMYNRLRMANKRKACEVFLNRRFWFRVIFMVVWIVMFLLHLIFNVIDYYSPLAFLEKSNSELAYIIFSCILYFFKTAIIYGTFQMIIEVLTLHYFQIKMFMITHFQKSSPHYKIEENPYMVQLYNIAKMRHSLEWFVGVVFISVLIYITLETTMHIWGMIVNIKEFYDSYVTLAFCMVLFSLIFVVYLSIAYINSGIKYAKQKIGVAILYMEYQTNVEHYRSVIDSILLDFKFFGKIDITLSLLIQLIMIILASVLEYGSKNYFF